MLVKYQRSDMVYNDYKWQARADHDNLNFIHGTDSAELNRLKATKCYISLTALPEPGTGITSQSYPTNAWNGLYAQKYHHRRAPIPELKHGSLQSMTKFKKNALI